MRIFGRSTGKGMVNVLPFLSEVTWSCLSPPVSTERKRRKFSAIVEITVRIVCPTIADCYRETDFWAAHDYGIPVYAGLCLVKDTITACNPETAKRFGSRGCRCSICAVHGDKSAVAAVEMNPD